MGILEDIFTAAFWETEPPVVPEWVEWVHISEGLTHCEVCLSLDKRWFLNEIAPELPQHSHCHCTVKPIPLSRVLNEATARCEFSKFDPYLFDPDNYYKHKKGAMFESRGYGIEDFEWLRQEFERQGLEKYVAGEYTLGLLNERGQRISIRIELPRRDKEGTVSFITGWMVYPNGQIQLTTPYGGK